MPVFDRLVDHLMEAEHGTQIFDGRSGECETMPDFWEIHDKTAERLDAALARVDWNRVLLEASIQHLRLQEADESHKDSDFADHLCGECMDRAMRARDHFWYDKG